MNMVFTTNMKNKILFFTDGWFLNYGIAKFLQENSDHELYAIIDVADKAKIFFQNQKFVNYKKIWYFMDYIKKTNKLPDLEYLSSIEKKYKINLWSIAFTDREFHLYSTVHKFTEQEILSLLEQECKFFEKVLDEVNPDFLSIMLSTSHSHELLCALCKGRGIKTLMLSTSRLRHGMLISQEGGILDNKNFQNYASKLTPKEQEDYIVNYHASKEMDEYKKSNYENHLADRYISLLKFFFLPKSDSYKNRYANYGRTRKNVLKYKLGHFLRKRYRYFFINRNFKQTLDNKTRFIYFPLQMEPERVLLVSARYYTNQISVITNIAKSLPVGFQLYVKEHPIMSIWGWRSTNFYKQIMDLPNVKLIHPSMHSDEIISKSSLVITIAGTAAQEAAFHHNPAITFTDQIYCILPSVYKLNNIEELPEAIRTSLEKKVTDNSICNFIEIMKKETFDFPLVAISSDFTYRFGFKGLIMDADLPIQKVEQFLNDYEAEFKKLALEHEKKIKEYNKQSVTSST